MGRHVAVPSLETVAAEAAAREAVGERLQYLVDQNLAEVLPHVSWDAQAWAGLTPAVRRIAPNTVDRQDGGG